MKRLKSPFIREMFEEAKQAQLECNNVFIFKCFDETHQNERLGILVCTIDKPFCLLKASSHSTRSNIASSVLHTTDNGQTQEPERYSQYRRRDDGRRCVPLSLLFSP
jgi:hypothetical protein